MKLKIGSLELKYHPKNKRPIRHTWFRDLRIEKEMEEKYGKI